MKQDKLNSSLDNSSWGGMLNSTQRCKPLRWTQSKGGLEHLGLNPHRGRGRQTALGIRAVKGQPRGGRRSSSASGWVSKVGGCLRTVHFHCRLSVWTPQDGVFQITPLVFNTSSSHHLFHHLSAIYILFPNPEFCHFWEDFNCLPRQTCLCLSSQLETMMIDDQQMLFLTSLLTSNLKPNFLLFICVPNLAGSPVLSPFLPSP